MRCARKKRKAPRLAGLKEKKLSAALLMCFSSASTKCSSRRSRATPARPRNVAVESNRCALAHMPSAVWAAVCNEPNRSTAQRSGCSRRRRHSDAAEAQRDSFDPHTHAPPRPSHACAAMALYSAGSSVSPTGPVRTSGRSSQRARVRAGLAHLRERRELLDELLERLECLRAGDESVPARNRHALAGTSGCRPTRSARLEAYA